jgi:hypothetical protein
LKANLAKKRPVLASANVVALLAGGLAILAGVRKVNSDIPAPLTAAAQRFS